MCVPYSVPETWGDEDLLSSCVYSSSVRSVYEVFRFSIELQSQWNDQRWTWVSGRTHKRRDWYKLSPNKETDEKISKHSKDR